MSSLLAASSQFSAWSQLVHAITQTDSLDRIYGAALDAIEAGLHVERASILLFDPDGKMRFKAWRGEDCRTAIARRSKAIHRGGRTRGTSGRSS
jgi:hypothetical protein